MKLLVTGATGYVGHQLALELASKKFTVHVLVRDLNSKKIPKHKNIKIFEGNICNYKSIEKAIEQCTYVFHAAAYTNLKCTKIDNFYNTNVLGTENLLRASLQNKVKKVIYTSTLSVFGPSYNNAPIIESQPRIASYTNDYELTKSMSEEVVKDYIKKGLTCIVLNVSKVYGPGLETYSNGVNKLILKIIRNDFLLAPDKLKISSNYVFINDVVKGHLLAMEHGKNGENYIIGGENISYDALFKKIKRITKSEIRIITVNYGFLKAFFLVVSAFQKFIGYQPAITPKVLDSLFINRIATSDKAIENINYKVTSLNLGLTRTINYLKN